MCIIAVDLVALSSIRMLLAHSERGYGLYFVFLLTFRIVQWLGINMNIKLSRIIVFLAVFLLSVIIVWVIIPILFNSNVNTDSTSVWPASMFQLAYLVGFALVSFVFLASFREISEYKIIKDSKRLLFSSFLCVVLFLHVFPDTIMISGVAIKISWSILLYFGIPFGAYLSTKYNTMTKTTIAEIAFSFYIFPCLVGFGVQPSAVDFFIVMIFALPLFAFSLAKQKRVRWWVVIVVIISLVWAFGAGLARSETNNRLFQNELIDAYRYTPLIGASQYNNVSKCFSAAYQTYGIGSAPLLFLLQFGWLAFIGVLLIEGFIVWYLFSKGNHAASNLGRYLCHYVGIVFLVRILLSIVSFSFFPLSSISFPFQGGLMSSAADVFLLIIASRSASMIHCDEKPLIDLDSSTQITITAVLQNIWQGIIILSKRCTKKLIKPIIRYFSSLSKEIENEHSRESCEDEAKKSEVKVPPYSSDVATTKQSNKAKGDNMINIPDFKIGVTFCGEYRKKYVQPFCEALLKYDDFTKVNVFYDAWQEPLINGPKGDDTLRKIYNEKCQLVIVLLSPNYQEKKWTNNIEWPAIRELINTGRDDKICLLRVDKAEINKIDGLWATQAIVKDIDDLSPDEIARFIYNKWNLVRSK